MRSSESAAFLSEQLITYLGNKRSLLSFIEKGVLYAKKELKKDKLSCADLFSGSGIVSRYLKQHSFSLIANDLEDYARVINSCYLHNADDEFLHDLEQEFCRLNREISQHLDAKSFQDALISSLYSPANDQQIQAGERAFYTNYNALFLDTARNVIAKSEFERFFLAPLLHEASVKVNTSGVFKGFYKNKAGIGQFGGEGQNALARITAKISLQMPIFSNFFSEIHIFQQDANLLAKDIEVDLCYLDPPYNQHPYGSNYFMLNLLANYQKPAKISPISGIVQGWNKSEYNRQKTALSALCELISSLRAKIILISYNNEGFIKESEFDQFLPRFGKVEKLTQNYNTYRASRNLFARAKHTNEILYILKKS